MTPQEIHNRDVGRIVSQIIRPTMEAGGKFTDVLILTESVMVSVILFGVKIGGDETVLDALVARVKEHLAELRLRDMDTAGGA